MKNIFLPKAALAIIFSISLVSCEKEFIPDTVNLEEELVVEAYIEAGDRPTPPIVMLTRSVPFFRELEADQLNGLFVHDAEIVVKTDDQRVYLQEICLNELTDSQRDILRQVTGQTIGNSELNICLYTDLSFQMIGKIGSSYELEIVSGSHHLSAQTTIPDTVGLEYIRFDQLPGEPSDTLRRMLCRINDPEKQENFYRYFTGINGGGLISPSNSVIDDNFFNGQSFEFPLPKAESPNTDFDPLSSGFYTVGDTVVLKWACIDKTHFDFWNTLEFAASNQGPFSTYTRVSSNVSGGLGFWGGLAAKYYTIIVEE